MQVRKEPPPEFFLTERELSPRIKKSVSWLQNARWRGDGPPFRKIGRRVVYRWSEVESWIESQNQSVA